VNSSNGTTTESFWVSLKRSWSSRAAVLLLAPLDEVQAAGIRRRDLPALGEDQLQQLVDVPLRREGDPDPVQVVQLLALAGEGSVELVDDAAVVDGVEGSLEAQAQAFRAHGPEQEVVEEGIAAQSLVGLAGIADAHEEGAQVAARLEPRLDGGLLGLELCRTDEDQAAALAVEVILELGKRAHLAARDPGRQRPGIKSRLFPQMMMFAMSEGAPRVSQVHSCKMVGKALESVEDQVRALGGQAVRIEPVRDAHRSRARSPARAYVDGGVSDHQRSRAATPVSSMRRSRPAGSGFRPGTSPPP
jgi:hypothetical protein